MFQDRLRIRGMSRFIFGFNWIGTKQVVPPVLEGPI